MGFMSKITKPIAIALTASGAALTITGAALLGVGCTTSYVQETKLADSGLGGYAATPNDIIDKIPGLKALKTASMRTSIGTGSSNFNSFPNIELKVDGKYWSIPDIAKDFDKKFDPVKLGEIIGGAPSGPGAYNIDTQLFAAPTGVDKEQMKLQIYQMLAKELITTELSVTGEQLSSEEQNKILQERLEKVKNVNDLIDVYKESTSNIGNIQLLMYLDGGLAAEWEHSHPNGEEYKELTSLKKMSYSDVANKAKTAKKGFEISKKQYIEENKKDENTENYKSQIKSFDESIAMMDKVSSANAMMISGAVLLPIFAIVMGLGIAALVINIKAGKKTNPTPSAE